MNKLIMPQQVAKTFCIQTRDAESRDDSTMTFKLKIDDPRTKGIKIALSSLEFPMTQYTIEKDWNRFYFSEGISFDYDTFSTSIKLKLEEEGTISDHHLDMPIRLNQIESWAVLGNNAVCTCNAPHCLHLLKNVDWGEVEVLCSPFGRTSITNAFKDNTLEIVSPVKFKIPISNTNLEVGTVLKSPNAGFLFVPSIPSPYHFCNILNSAASVNGLPVVLTFRYDQNLNKIITEVFSDKKNATIYIQESFLSRYIGIFTREKKLEYRKTTVIETEVFQGWDYVELEPGWYSPSHRSYCTGQPLRLSQEVESAFNRLYFPLPERIPSGHITSHFLIFTDPCGHLYTCPVPCGRYTPDILCEYLETQMTKLALKTTEGVEFTVEHIEDKFRISCEIKEDGKLSPAPFSLMFNHSMQFDPSKLGFSPQPLIGHDSYVADMKTHFPNTTPTRKQKSCLNIYRISEIGHQKKMRIHASTPPVLTGLIIGYNNDDCTLALKTYLGQLPYSHGYTKGDVVKLALSKSVEIFEYDSEEKTWNEATAEPCSLAPKFGRTAVVVGTQEKQDLEMCTIVLKVRKTPQLSSCIGNVLQIHSFIQPFNFCFTLYKSIKPEILGFRQGCLLWGIDGSIQSGDMMIPPYQGPYCHNLDHTDYVIMMLDEAKSTNLQHTSGETNKNIFAKIVLYPLAREVGMMPKDASLVGSSNITNFTIRFLNPDFTPYHFHGAEFSLSLTLLDVIGE